MNIWSRNLLLATQQTGKQTRVYASEEALQAALDIGSAIKINDGMGEDPYRYTAYPISTTKSGKFTYISRINKIKTNDNETFYYTSFNVPTNAVEIQSDISDSVITTFGDQDNANVTINVDQNQNGLAYKNSNEQIIYIGEDNKVYNNLKQYILPQPSKEFVTDGVEINNVFYARTSSSDVTDLPVEINSTADVETKTSVIRNQQLLECDSLTGYDLVKIENGGQLYNAGQQHLINNDSVTSLMLKYNNKTVYYQQQIANRNCFRKAHNVTINPSVSDCTIKFYNKTSSIDTIQGWNGQKINYEVSKTGYDTVTDSYTIPMDKDNRAYTLDVTMEEEIILPVGYTRLQYIETNNGNSWIDTGITTDTSDVYDVTFSVNSLPSYTSSTPGYMAVFGSGDADVDLFYTAFSGWNKWQLVWGSGTIDVPQITAINTWYHITAKNGVLTVNGNDISFSQATLPSALTMYIGRMHHQQASLTMYFDGKLKKFTITRAGSLFRQYVPTKYDLGGGSYSVGYYDTVTDTFLTSIGTYPFIAGPNY